MRLYKKSGAGGRRRFFPLLWTAGLASAAIVALGVTGTLSNFVASITNTQNHVETAGREAFGFSESLVTQNGQNVQLCASASASEHVTCPMSTNAFSINKYGENGAPAEPIAPGTTMETTVRLQNTVAQNTPAGQSGDLGFVVGDCSNVSSPEGANLNPGNLCNTVEVTISCSNEGATTIGPVTLEALSTGSNLTTPVAGEYSIATGIPPQGYVDCKFETVYPRGAAAANLQNVETSQRLTWTWTQA